MVERIRRRLIISTQPTMAAHRTQTIARSLHGHQCCYIHCDQPATVVMVESPHKLGRTFLNGAGIVCEQHALETEQEDGCKRIV